MFKTFHLIKRATVLVGCLLAPTLASAQFVGDVFFKKPSIAVAQGGTGQLELMSFAGTTPVGAYRIRLIFDESKLEITEVKAGGAVELEEGFTSRLGKGELDVVAVNNRSITTPIGTVSLLIISVRPKLAAGSVIKIEMQILDLLSTSVQPFSAKRAFGADVVVAAAALKTPSLVAPSARHTHKLAVGADTASRARRLAPPGASVQVMQLDQYQQPVSVSVDLEPEQPGLVPESGAAR